MVQEMATPTNHIIVPAGLHYEGPLALADFRNILLPNIGEDQKKSHHLSAGPLALYHMVNPALVIALRA